MKNIIIAVLIVTNIAVVAFAFHVERAETAKFSLRVQELDNFYYGFCQEVKDSGLGYGKNYQRLCGS